MYDPIALVARLPKHVIILWVAAVVVNAVMWPTVNHLFPRADTLTLNYVASAGITAVGGFDKLWLWPQAGFLFLVANTAAYFKMKLIDSNLAELLIFALPLLQIMLATSLGLLYWVNI